MSARIEQLLTRSEGGQGCHLEIAICRPGGGRVRVDHMPLSTDQQGLYIESEDKSQTIQIFAVATDKYPHGRHCFEEVWRLRLTDGTCFEFATHREALDRKNLYLESGFKKVLIARVRRYLTNKAGAA